jgi:hypothetical protein
MSSLRYLGRLALGSRGSESLGDGGWTVAPGDRVVTPATRADVDVPAGGFIGGAALFVETLANFINLLLPIFSSTAVVPSSSPG